jgi:hypothetical protein
MNFDNDDTAEALDAFEDGTAEEEQLPQPDEDADAVDANYALDAQQAYDLDVMRSL